MNHKLKLTFLELNINPFNGFRRRIQLQEHEDESAKWRNEFTEKEATKDKSESKPEE